jgi:hypothetical protein
MAMLFVECTSSQPDNRKAFLMCMHVAGLHYTAQNLVQLVFISFVDRRGPCFEMFDYQLKLVPFYANSLMGDIWKACGWKRSSKAGQSKIHFLSMTEKIKIEWLTKGVDD